MNNSTLIINELNNCHKVINKKLFKNELKEVMITFYTDPKDKKTLGHFTPQKVWNDNFNELVIKGLQLNGKSKDILGTLLHEMIHQYCTQNNINDVEKNGRHNKKFKEVAEKYGLEVHKPINKNYGYTTSIKDSTYSVLTEYNRDINIEMLENFKNTFSPIEKPKKVVTTYKYNCNDCDIKFTLTKKWDLKCSNCDIDLEIQ